MDFNIFAVDPGGTTGWAHTRISDHRLSPGEWTWMSGQLMGDEFQQSYDLWRMVRALWPCAVVIEDFIPRQLNQSRWFLSPVRVTNQLTMLLWVDKRRWDMQMPSLAKAGVSDEYLHDNNLWIKGEPHAMDATRHAIMLFRRAVKEPLLYQRLLSARGLDSATQI